MRRSGAARRANDRSAYDDRVPSPTRDQRLIISVIGVLSFIAGLFEATTIVAVVGVVNSIAADEDGSALDLGPFEAGLDSDQLVVAALVSVTLLLALQVANAWLQIRATIDWHFATVLRMVEAYLRADWPTQSQQTSGEVQTAWLGHVSNASKQIGALATMLNAALGGGVLVVIAIIVAPIAAVALAVGGALLVVSLRPFTLMGKRAAGEDADRAVAAADSVADVRDHARDIRVFGAAGSTLSRVEATHELLKRARLRAQRVSALVPTIQRSLALVIIVLAVVFASRLESIDLVAVGAAGLLLLRAVGYGQRAQGAAQMLAQSTPYVERVQAMYQRYRDARHRSGQAVLGTTGDIRLEGVSYTYPHVPEPALSGVDLTIRSGEMIGLVGPSGSGKSTLAQVILGLREPSAGHVYVNDTEIKDLDEVSFAGLVSFVPQDPRLLRDTVASNVTFYRDIDRDAVERACQSAGVHEEILALPDGYDTVLGDGKRELSGGQRQRIGIARALVGEPQLLVLDEPTSALDMQSEARIQEVLETLHGQITVVVIAHRLSTLKRCDRLAVMNEGVLEIVGPPEEIRLKNAFYRRAVELSALQT